MSDLENNKIFAAVLCAGVTIMLTGFVANKVIKPKKLKEDAVKIEGASADAHGGAPAKPQLPEPILAMLADADIEKGAKISKACAACHSFEKGGPTKQGPNLWNVVNTLKCEVSDFSYSTGLKEVGGSWGYESLNFFLWKPKKYAPGTKMNFAGLKKPKDRAALIAWLRTLSDDVTPLPTAEEITAEETAFAGPEETHAEETHAEETHTEATSTEEVPAEQPAVENIDTPKAIEEIKETVEKAVKETAKEVIELPLSLPSEQVEEPAH